jgi:hypothetical protein
MSGMARAFEEQQFYRIDLNSGIYRAIKAERRPDGTTKGPGEYFKRMNASYTEWLARARHDLETLVADAREELSIIAYSGKQPLPKGRRGPGTLALEGSVGREQFELTVTVAEALPAKSRKMLIENVGSILERHRRPH